MINSKRLFLSSPMKKRFRTDILIDEQANHLKLFEYELKLRNLREKIINTTDKQASFSYLTQISGDDFDFNFTKRKKSTRPVSSNDFDKLVSNDNEQDKCLERESKQDQGQDQEQDQDQYQEQDQGQYQEQDQGQEDQGIIDDEINDEDAELMYQSNESLLKNYYRNLIRLNVVKKFNIELEFHRILLDKAMRNNQSNLIELRSKVDWLENEIETIILSNKHISFPLQRKLLNDQSLKVEKIDKSLLIKQETMIEPEIEIKETEIVEEMTADQQEMNKIANLLSMWDKKSESSEISFSDTGTNENEAEHEPTILSPKSENSKQDENLEKAQDETLSEEIEENLSLKQDKSDLEAIPVLEQQLTIMENDDKDEEEELKLYEENIEPTMDSTKEIEQDFNEQDIEQKENVPFYLRPHNRFEYADYSKKMVALNYNSYHRLGLSLTDTYVHDVFKIDGKVPVIEKKELLDINDIKLLNIANRMEDIYRAICKSTDQFKTADQFQSYNNKMDRLSALSLDSTKRFKSVMTTQRKNISLRPKTFEPQRIPKPKTPLPQLKKNREVLYPRDPLVYSMSAPQLKRNFKYPPRLVNQHNLREQTKFKLYFPKDEIKEMKPDLPAEDKREELYKIPTQINWEQIKPNSESNFKLEKIKTLLTIDLKTNILDQKRDAIKHIGLLKMGDNVILFALNSILNNENEHDLVKFECSKSLVLLGDWNEIVCSNFIRYIKHGNWNVRNEVLNTIINSKNTQFNKDLPSIKLLVSFLEYITAVKFDERIALNASICIGKLGSKNSQKALKRLNDIIDSQNFSSDFWYLKTLALEALVKNFDKKDNKTIEHVLHQIENSPLWISRTSAMQLLSYLGANVVCKSDQIEKVYKLLETRLSEDPIWEVRLEVGNTIRELMLFEKVFARMSKNLENTDPEMRGKAVVAMEMLGVKKAKVLQTLIDMLELDGNEHVRTLVLKALFSLAPNNPKVVFAFNNLEKNSRIYQVFLKLKEQKNKSTKILAKRN